METNNKPAYYYYYYYYAYLAVNLVMWVGYLWFTFTGPVSQQALTTYHVTEAQIRLLVVTIVVPFFFAWFFGQYGVFGILRYSETIKGTVEQKGLNIINTGLAALVFGFVLTSLIGTGRSYWTACPSGIIEECTANLKIFQIITNYLTMIGALVSTYLMYKGSKLLLTTVDAMEQIKKRKMMPYFTLAIVSIVYVALFFLNPVREVASPLYPTVKPTYYLSDAIVLPTLILPYIVAWGFGLMAAMQMQIYRDKVQGTIYKSALSSFVNGFLTIVMTSITFQIISTIGYQFASFNLSSIFILIYALLLILGLGYVFMAIGARRLKKIEVV